MAQHDYVIANGTGAAVRSDLNTALSAIVTQNSGATAPSTPYAYQWWADTANTLLKIRNGANNAWITVGPLDTTNLGFLATDGSGNFLFGPSTARTNIVFGANQETPKVQFETAVNDYSGAGFSIINNSDTGFAPSLWIGRSNGTTVGSNTLLASGSMAHISFVANDGAKFVAGARITAATDGTTGLGDMPTSLQFLTCPDGSASLAEAMRINRDQKLWIGYTSDNGAYKLQVNSQIFATSATIATSDGRYKDNVATLGGCLDIVKALRPVSFTWKPQTDILGTDDEGNQIMIREGHNFPAGTQVGFIAQEVQQAMAGQPWLSSIIKENTREAIYDKDGNELAAAEQFFGIAEGNMIAVLTSALQETVARLEAVEAELAALKA